MRTSEQLLGLAGWMAVAFAAAAVGAAASIEAGPFYAELARPAWAPPGSVFGPVWTVLYALMGVKKPGTPARLRAGPSRLMQ